MTEAAPRLVLRTHPITAVAVLGEDGGVGPETSGHGLLHLLRQETPTGNSGVMVQFEEDHGLGLDFSRQM